jgi:hypothetical protein
MRSESHIVRHVVRVTWRCKHCREVFGQENVAHYGGEPPNMIKPTWFFAAMTLLDHLRDCQQTDLSPTLAATYGADFLKHPRIWEFFNVHALVERKLMAEEELDEQ